MASLCTPARSFRVFVVLALTLSLSAFSLSAANALNGSPTTANGVIQLPFAQIVTFGDGADPTILRLPVPAGLTPVRIVGNLSSTLKRVADVTAVPTPATVSRPRVTHVAVGKSSVPLNASLSQAEIVDGFVSLALDVTDPPDEGFCAAGDPGKVTLAEIALEVSGEPVTPTSPANFVDTSTEQVRVVIPDDASSTQMSAGLNAVASLTAAFRSQARVRLFTSKSVALEAPLSPIRGRLVTISDGPEEVVTTVVTKPGGVPTLELKGSGAGLPRAASALGSMFISLADTPLTTGLTQTLNQVAGLTQPLEDLGAGETLALTGYGKSIGSVTVPQAAFGGPISAAVVNLHATQTVVPAEVLSSVNIFWNDFLVASYSAISKETALDFDIAIPSTRMRSSNSLRFEYTAVPRQGGCTGPVGLLPMGLYVDTKATTVVGQRGQSLDPGFPRFPQVLADSLPVAFSTGLPTSAAATSAGDLVAGLQTVNPRQLDVSVVEAEAFIEDCDTGLFIGGTAEDATALAAPVRLSQFRTFDGLALEFGVGADSPVSVLEAFARNSCNVLMLAAWAPTAQEAGQVDLALEVARYPVDSEFGWSALYGSMLVGLPDRTEPVQLGTKDVVPQEEIKEEYRPYGLWFAVALIALVIVGLLGALVRRRRLRKIRRYVEAELRAQDYDTPNPESTME
ncbi:MAG: hypothetical protein Q7K25_00070 [Actinomycetota bacterium]|nr:hypothetical protein [Actinomycetota bacterium]